MNDEECERWATPALPKTYKHACDTTGCENGANKICDCGRWACKTCLTEEHRFCYPEMS